MMQHGRQRPKSAVLISILLCNDAATSVDPVHGKQHWLRSPSCGADSPGRHRQPSRPLSRYAGQVGSVVLQFTAEDAVSRTPARAVRLCARSSSRLSARSRRATPPQAAKPPRGNGLTRAGFGSRPDPSTHRPVSSATAIACSIERALPASHSSLNRASPSCSRRACCSCSLGIAHDHSPE